MSAPRTIRELLQESMFGRVSLSTLDSHLPDVLPTREGQHIHRLVRHAVERILDLPLDPKEADQLALRLLKLPPRKQG